MIDACEEERDASGTISLHDADAQRRDGYAIEYTGVTGAAERSGGAVVVCLE